MQEILMQYIIYNKRGTMRLLLLFTLFGMILFADQLKVKATQFYGDEKQGLSVFTGNVKVQKGSDELNASKVTVYIDAQKQPTKFIADGNVSFILKTEDNATYFGQAQKAIYYPKKKQYNFYTDVHLRQIGDTKVVEGDEVVLNLLENKAHAIGHDEKPVIMIFDVQEKKQEKQND